MIPTAHERALQAARALRERQPATLLLWRSLGNLSHGFLLPVAAILMWLALATFSAADPAWSHTSNASDVVYQNKLGVYGAWFSDVAFWLFGKLAYALPILILLCNAHYWATYKVRLVPVYVGFATLVVRWLGFVFGFCSVLLCGSLIAHALLPDTTKTVWQGIAGSGLSTAVLSLGPPAAFFVVLGLLSLSVTMLFERSYTWLLDVLGWPFVALFEKISGSIAAKEQVPSYARGDDFQFDFERYETVANGRHEPAFELTEQLQPAPIDTVTNVAASPAAFSALDDDELAVAPQPAAELMRERIEPSMADDFDEDAPQASSAAQAVTEDDDDFGISLAATQRIGAAELTPELIQPSAVDDIANEDTQHIDAGFDRNIVDQHRFDKDEFGAELVTNAKPVIDEASLREPTISFDDDLLEPSDESDTAQRKPIPALHAESDLAEAAQAAKNFTLDSRAIANLRLHYSDTQSLSPLMMTQTAQLTATSVDDDDEFAATGEFDPFDEGLLPASFTADLLAPSAVEPAAVQPALDLQPAIAADDDLEFETLEADIPASNTSVSNPLELAAVDETVESVAESIVEKSVIDESVIVDEPVTAEALAPVDAEIEAAASKWQAPVMITEQQSALLQERLVSDEQGVPNNAAHTLNVSLPPILDETLNGPLTAIPLLDQTLSIPVSALPFAAEPLSETATSHLRSEVDEFSHVDYDDEDYSSPIKSSVIKSSAIKSNVLMHEPQTSSANQWLSAAADSLQALSQDLANTQLPEPFVKSQTQSTEQLSDAKDDWEESDSLSAALDALAKTAMFRHDNNTVTASASANFAAEAAPVVSAASIRSSESDIDSAPATHANSDINAKSDINAEPVVHGTPDAALTKEHAREADAVVDVQPALSELPSASLSAAIEERLSQTAKLLAADVSASLRNYEARSAAVTVPDTQLASDWDADCFAVQPVAEPVSEAASNHVADKSSAQISAAQHSFTPPALTPTAATQVTKTVDQVEPVLINEVQSPAPSIEPKVAQALPPHTPSLRTHPQAGPVIPVNPALAAAMISAQAVPQVNTAPANTVQAPVASSTLADTINFSSAKPVNLQGSFAAPVLPVASADKHSLDIFASDPSIRRLSYNCATAVQVGDVGLPPLSLLRRIGESERKGFSEEKLVSMSRLLEEKLADFGVEIKVANVLPGPVITRFEVLPAPGIKASRISGLSTDLARSLAVTSVRVLEVIPGTSCVGIEVPNAEREMVYLGDVLNSEEYQAAEDPLTLALGYDISGQPAIANLGKMPHVLVAGTTGSGKSVGVNTMLLSMLFKASPEDVRLILVDPKFLELSVYERIPHLLTPVITDMNIAANALRWAVGEMERRYQLMSKMGVRNLAGFNQKVVAAEQAGSPLEDPIWQVDPDDTSASKYVRPYLCKLPSIVIVIDEFADMMMMAGKKCEVLITRIAQKARAAGIHLVLATQRPSVDVITGLIKANIPTRIAFTVSTKIDSRTILDQSGAEELLGAGDMLFAPPNARTVMRVHGAFVSDDEVHAVISDWCSRAEPNYMHSILDEQSSVSVPGLVDETPVGADGSRPDDVLYDQVLDFILTTRKASISAVQRRFGIGYNRSAKIIESMEAAGVLGPAGTGAGNSRDILIGTDDD